MDESSGRVTLTLGVLSGQLSGNVVVRLFTVDDTAEGK